MKPKIRTVYAALIFGLFFSIGSLRAEVPECVVTPGPSGPGGPPGNCAGAPWPFTQYVDALKGLKGVEVNGVPSGCCPERSGLIANRQARPSCSFNGSVLSCSGLNYQQWNRYNPSLPAMDPKNCAIVQAESSTGSTTAAVDPGPSAPTPTPPGPVLVISNTDTGPGGTRTQIFRVTTPIIAGATYRVGVYSVDVTVTAVAGDTPTSIAQKIVDAVNSMTAAQWMAVYSTFDPPASCCYGKEGFKPTGFVGGTSPEYANFVLKLNFGNQFGAGVMGP